jgi:uncharacterized membrane protein YeaQ/YmgE (transglycosylase-associated protein family)
MAKGPAAPTRLERLRPSGRVNQGEPMSADVFPRQGSLPQALSGGSMAILMWIIAGLITGTVASLIMPGDGPGGFFVTIAFGITGALLGGFIGTQVHRPFLPWQGIGQDRSLEQTK